MTDSRQSDGGCLSAICSCFKRREKPRHDVSGSPSTGVDVLPASKSADDGQPEPTDPKVVRSDSVLSVSRATSSTGNADDPSLLPASKVPGPSALNGSTSTVDLWQEACKKVDVKTQIWIASLPPPSNVQNPASELAEFVRASEEKHKQESLKLKSGDREILWRDYANKVIPVVTAIGNIAINFAPAPSNAVWSAIKVLLAAHVSEREDLVAIMGCTDIVLCLVRRGRVYEKVYIGNSMSPRPPYQEDLMTKLVEVYAKCLEFLAFVYEEMEHGSLRRFFDALVDPGYGENRLSAVRALEQELELATRSCKATADDEHRRLLESLEEPIKRTDKNVMDILKVLDKQERDKAMEYVSVIPVGSHHNEKVEKRTKGTCEWLVSRPEFLEWEDSDYAPVFWLQGDIGTGKSFLSSKVIDHYRFHDKFASSSSSEPSVGLAFFYCNSSDRNRQSYQSILRSYVRQLGEVTGHPESIHEELFKLYQSKQIQSDITLKDCEKALVEMINSYPRTVLILDALDECNKDTRRHIVELFKRLVEKTNSLKIFIASRPEHDISDHLRSFQELRATITINTSDNQDDIEKFVNTEVDNFTVDWSPETKQVVKEKLAKKSKGMFRWTYLQWEQLKEYETNTTVKARLGDLPRTLTKAYDEICDKHEPESFERFMLQRAVRWVMCARQPLDSCELLSAIRVESEQMHRDGMKALDKSDLTEKMLETVCRHLIVRDPELKVWRFSHASVREYFEDKKGEPWVKDAPAEPFANFAFGVVAMGLHRFLPEWWNEGLDLPSLVNENGLSLLQIATFVGHYDVCQFLISRGCDVNASFHFLYGPPLWISVAQRKIDVMELLLKNGANVDCVFKNRSLACLAATVGSEYCTVLLKNGLDPNTKCPRTCSFGCALSAATWKGDLDAIKTLVSEGADVNPENLEDLYGCPLINAIESQNPECVRLLLEHGADVNAMPEGCRYGSPLAAAVWRRNVDCARLLIEYGADVNADLTFGKHGSPLAAAVWSGNVDCVRLLIEHGAEVNAYLEFGKYGSILDAAIFGFVPSLVMIKFLVEEAGADLAQLAFVRPRRKEVVIWRRQSDQEDAKDVAAYLIQELQMERQVLISLGVLPRDLPPDVGNTADMEYEELDDHDLR
ncbi:uncharacterized protein CLUP02_14998 [Colletotrichum lupini]|uniref:NACHT domain-containing protein n=1 Tax=Colletotrichum lupini TaxID=145971 RepID=A0A9Q8WNK9_9PEZI|nr:uncharacterized protein CLUP02_14998 [Colletotrichum lupini]UQC89467.1 hypothetical protein CLUP02_14998 [Colletotrichum lupini]